MIASNDAERDSWIETITTAKKALEAKKTATASNGTSTGEIRERIERQEREGEREYRESRDINREI